MKGALTQLREGTRRPLVLMALYGLGGQMGTDREPHGTGKDPRPARRPLAHPCGDGEGKRRKHCLYTELQSESTVKPPLQTLPATCAPRRQTTPGSPQQNGPDSARKAHLWRSSRSASKEGTVLGASPHPLQEGSQELSPKPPLRSVHRPCA